MTGRIEFRPALLVVAACACLAASAERQPVERYQSIIDRQMFGQPPPNFDPTVPPGLVQKGSSEEKELTREQEDKYHEYTWERVALNRNDSEEEIARLGNLYTVRVIVRWGNGRTSKREEESYVTFWRKKE